jgi:hypothetical protein
MAILDKEAKRIEDEKMEHMLRPKLANLAKWEPKQIPLKDGRTLVVREARRDEIDLLLEVVHPLIKLDREMYDLVGVRVYGELLSWKKYRVQDEYCLVGVIDGVLAGIVNGRQMNPKLGLSYHTFSLLRGGRVGANLFASKMEYHMDFLGHDEVLIVAESSNGFRRWMEEYGLKEKFHVAHELGGVPTYVLDRETYTKMKPTLVLGSRPVDAALLASTQNLKKPDLSYMWE